jgi:hypothetical protein
MLAQSVPAVSAGCDPGFTNSLNATQHFVDSIRADKPGLARVYASNATEFTAGQALWMKGELREINDICARGQQAEAAERLASVRRLIDAHAPNAQERRRHPYQNL